MQLRKRGKERCSWLPTYLSSPLRLPDSDTIPEAWAQSRMLHHLADPSVAIHPSRHHSGGGGEGDDAVVCFSFSFGTLKNQHPGLSGGTKRCTPQNATAREMAGAEGKGRQGKGCARRLERTADCGTGAKASRSPRRHICYLLAVIGRHPFHGLMQS